MEYWVQVERQNEERTWLTRQIRWFRFQAPRSWGDQSDRVLRKDLEERLENRVRDPEVQSFTEKHGVDKTEEVKVIKYRKGGGKVYEGPVSVPEVLQQ